MPSTTWMGWAAQAVTAQAAVTARADRNANKRFMAFPPSHLGLLLGGQVPPVAAALGRVRDQDHRQDGREHDGGQRIDLRADLAAGHGGGGDGERLDGGAVGEGGEENKEWEVKGGHRRG